MSIKYGIQKCTFGSDSKENTVIKFGDGMNRITSALWTETETRKEIAGVQIVRPAKDDNAPFAVIEPDADGYVGVNDALEDDKVYIVFDNKDSIDALVSALNEAKNFL